MLTWTGLLYDNCPVIKHHVAIVANKIALKLWVGYKELLITSLVLCGYQNNLLI